MYVLLCSAQVMMQWVEIEIKLTYFLHFVFFIYKATITQICWIVLKFGTFKKTLKVNLTKFG